jgi:hypothetical protein
MGSVREDVGFGGAGRPHSALAHLPFQAIDAAAQLVELALAGQSKILEQLIAVALQLTFGLLFQLRRIATEGPQHILHKG